MKFGISWLNLQQKIWQQETQLNVVQVIFLSRAGMANPQQIDIVWRYGTLFFGETAQKKQMFTQLQKNMLKLENSVLCLDPF